MKLSANGRASLGFIGEKESLLLVHKREYTRGRAPAARRGATSHAYNVGPLLGSAAARDRSPPGQ
jgi:hypothetical protein